MWICWIGTARSAISTPTTTLWASAESRSFTDRSVPHALEKRLSWWHGLFSRHDEEFSDERRREHRPEWDRSVTPHDLRRTFAKEYYHELREQDLPPRIAFGKVAEALGHGKNRMELAKHYLDDAALEEIENDPA